MNEYNPETFIRYLQDELIQRCKKNSSYSVRAFARTLNVDSSTLTKILNGKRKVGKRAVFNLAARLGLKAEEIQNIMQDNPVHSNFQKLDEDTVKVISDWVHFGILELLRIDGVEHSVQWMANAFGISYLEIKDALRRLERLGMIKKVDEMWLDLTEVKTTTIPRISTDQPRKDFQKQVLEMAVTAINTVDYNNRSNTSVTMAIDKELLPEAIEEITKFRRKLTELLSRSEKRNEVYNLAIALYPLTHLDNLENKND